MITYCVFFRKNTTVFTFCENWDGQTQANLFEEDVWLYPICSVVLIIFVNYIATCKYATIYLMDFEKQTYGARSVQ